jgi:hypothetical protein
MDACDLRSQIGDLECSVGEEGDHLGEFVGVREAAQHAELLEHDRDLLEACTPTTNHDDGALGPRCSHTGAHAGLAAGAFEDHVGVQPLDGGRLDSRIECAVGV